jgi:hypothetical protein
VGCGVVCRGDRLDVGCGRVAGRPWAAAGASSDVGARPAGCDARGAAVTPGLLASPVLWMAFGAMVAGLLVGLVGLAGAVVSRWWRRGQSQDTAGTAGWELSDG